MGAYKWVALHSTWNAIPWFPMATGAELGKFSLREGITGPDLGAKWPSHETVRPEVSFTYIGLAYEGDRVGLSLRP